MIKSLLLCIALFSLVNLKCLSGCLKCNTRDECLVSDVANLYKLNGVDAELVKIDRCELIDFLGACLSCKAGYYSDAGTKLCVEVVGDAVIDNCENYIPGTSCISCKPNFYLSNNICKAVEPLIDSCVYYTSETECRECDGDKLVSVDGKSCIDSPSIQNCIAYSYVSCNRCAGGLVMSYNGYMVDWLRVSSDADKKSLVDLVITISSGNRPILPLTACETALTQNCLEFEDGVNKCKKCVSGYFLSEESLCVANPLPPLENCEIYSSTTSCIRCLPFHYFQTSTCTEIVETKQKVGCISYDPIANLITCTECNGKFFLTNNSCRERVDSKDDLIKNCLEKSIIEDKCVRCGEGFVLTDDGLECIKEQENCEEYEPKTKGTNLLCKKCKDTFYVKFNLNMADPACSNDTTPCSECLTGTVENCAQYQNTFSDKCVECLNGFYIDNGVCLPSNEIEGCTKYHKTVKTSCEVCTKDSSFNLVLFNKCLPITSPIQFCKAHSGNNINGVVCDECIDGYELKNTACEEISIAGCLSTDVNNNCLACEKNFAISTNKLNCMSPLSYIKNRCLEDSTADSENEESITEVVCRSCKEHAYPIDIKDHFVCIQDSQLNQYSNGPTVANCLKYDSNLQCLQCDPASGDRYLKSNNTCVSGCAANNSASTYKKVSIDTTDANKHELSQFNVCMAEEADCLVKSPDLSVTGLPLICVGCMENHFPVVSLLQNNYTMVDPQSTDFPYIPAPFFMYPKLSCISTTSTTIDGSASSSTINQDNCEFYIDDSGQANDYNCLKCKFGFTSSINENGHLDSCSSYSQCSSRRLNNIGLYWEKLFSCHSCADSNSQIPFIAYKATSTQDPSFVDFETWSLTVTSDTYADSTGLQKNIVCLNNSASTFGITPNSDYGVDENCALGVIITNSNAFTRYHDTPPLYQTTCAACKPGYSKTNADASQFAKSCTSINNCAIGGDMANGCQFCLESYIHNYKANAIVFSDPAETCLLIQESKKEKLSNCWAADSEANSLVANECQICKKGYVLNKDRICELVIPFNCKINKFRASFIIEEDTLGPTSKYNYLFYQQGSGVGCNECEQSHSAVKITVSHNICVDSDWINNTVDSFTDLSKTNFIPYCRFYNASDASTLMCSQCDPGYVIKGDANGITGDECYPEESLLNCTIAENSGTCLRCINNTFSLVNGACIQGNIDNCSTYNYNNSSTKIECVSCVIGYYLTDTNECLTGQVKHCIEFANNQANTCNTCANGFKLVTVKDGLSYCFPVPSDLLCGDMDITNSGSGALFKCNACADKKAYIVGSLADEENSTRCVSFVYIPNCETYDITETLLESSFKCLKCEIGYFYDTLSNNCVKRAVLPDKCLEYNLFKDECSLCEKGSYFTKDKKECINNPSGIIGCVEYELGVTCLACEQNRYLEDNKCYRIESTISNCVKYSSKNSCALCADTFVLEGNKCNKADAKNCLTYKTVNECETCHPADGLLQSGDFLNCVSKADLGCAEVKDEFPYECVKCKSTFYMDEGKCKSPKTIDNCILYEGNERCGMCGAGFVLSADKKKCKGDEKSIALIPLNCEESIELEVPVCSRCDPSYQFEKDACVQLCDDGISSGCFMCDPRTPETCFICKPGYYQNKDGQCSINTVEGNNNSNGGGDGDGDQTVGISIETVRNLILLLVVVMR